MKGEIRCPQCANDSLILKDHGLLYECLICKMAFTTTLIEILEEEKQQKEKV